MEQFLSAKFLSGRNANLKAGIVGYSTGKSLEVVGRAGIGSTIFEPIADLDVRGSINADFLNVNGNGYFTGIVTSSGFYVGGSLIGSASSLATLYVSGVSTFVGFSTFNDSVDIQDDLLVRGNTRTLGITTLSANGGITTTGGDLYVGGDLYIKDDLFFDEFTARNARVTGITTLGITSTTNLTAQQLNVSGVSTFAGITTVTGSTLFSKQLNVSGVTTFVNGPVLIGSATSTGTASQRLQVTGGTYVSGSVGIGTTNPREEIDVIGDIGVQASGSANRFIIQHNNALSSLDFVFI